MDFWRIFIFLIILISTFSVWKDFSKKFEKSEGAEARKNTVVLFLLKIFLLILAIAVFIF